MLEKLRQLGWSDYEAKAYLALLRHNPATGYRVGKESGVPVAKVYEALARLVGRGAARLLPASEGETAQYVPVAPEEITAGIRARQLQILEELTQELTALRLPAPETPTSEWLRGRAPVLGRANALLTLARESAAVVLPQGWESMLRIELDLARSRQVRVDRVVLPAEGVRRSPALFLLVVDGEEALIGTLGTPSDDSAAEAFATRTPFLVRLCSDYVRLCRAVALDPDAVARLERHDDWLDWEEAKQRRLLQHTAAHFARPRATPN